MLIEQVEKALELSEQSQDRKLILGWSGGPDSTALMDLLSKLQKKHRFRLALVHINFNLRGQESQDDEDFCRSEAKKRSLNLIVHRVSEERWKAAAIQETARQIKLEISARILPDWDWIEAHHADDQLETFLFRLFRGSGLHGLSCMKEKSIRAGLHLFRPFLKIKKFEIQNYLRENVLKFQQDRSNETDVYDRNFLRLNILPKLKERFPNLHESIFRLQEQIREEEVFFEEQVQEQGELLQKENSELFLHRSKIRELSKPLRFRFYHQFFSKSLGLNLSRTQIQTFDAAIMREGPVSFNAPRGIIIRSEKSKNGPSERLKIDF